GGRRYAGQSRHLGDRHADRTGSRMDQPAPDGRGHPRRGDGGHHGGAEPEI
ncbi:MAG: hypothetical protein AVDCRST_MAG27-10, partial [uncultured Craurococcus sp.]